MPIHFQESRVIELKKRFGQIVSEGCESLRRNKTSGIIGVEWTDERKINKIKKIRRISSEQNLTLDEIHDIKEFCMFNVCLVSNGQEHGLDTHRATNKLMKIWLRKRRKSKN